MKTIFNTILCISMFVICSCEKNNETLVDNSDLLIGYWLNSVSEDTLMKYERVSSFDEHYYGISFQPGQAFVERTLAGFCATPPVSYANYNGTWTRNGSSLKIKVDFWGGKAEHQWEIISVDNNTLTIYRIKDEYNMQN